MEEFDNNNLQPELKDILNRIHAYNAVHKEGCFVFRFVGFKDEGNICECGEGCLDYDEEKSLIGAYGDLEVLRNMLNELRDLIEDTVDEEDFVNI